MEINIYLASKNVGWKREKLPFPSYDECVLIATKVSQGSQEAYERLLAVRRFSSSDEWKENPEGAALLDYVYNFVRKQKH